MDSRAALNTDITDSKILLTKTYDMVFGDMDCKSKLLDAVNAAAEWKDGNVLTKPDEHDDGVEEDKKIAEAAKETRTKISKIMALTTDDMFVAYWKEAQKGENERREIFEAMSKGKSGEGKSGEGKSG